MQYSYFDTIKSKHCQPVTVEQLMDRTKQTDIKIICDAILSSLDKGDEKEASRLKASLPVIVLGQLYEEGQPRSKNGGKPTGLLMFDYDDCKSKDEAQQVMLRIKEKYLSDLYLQDIIVAAHYSPRMHGIHIWYRWFDGCSSYSECNAKLAKLLDLSGYDEVCKDNSRCSFLVPYSYFDIINMDAMQNNEAFAELQLKQEQKSDNGCRNNSTHSDDNNINNNADSSSDSDSVGNSDRQFPKEYEGVGYDRIVRELTIACAPKSKIDQEGNVLEGARDSTFFKLAVLLRYLCDNNPKWLYSLAPKWAFDLDKDKPGRVMEICQSVCNRTHSYSFPKTLNAVLTSFKKEQQAAEEEESLASQEEGRQQQCVNQLNNLEECKRKFLTLPEVLPPIFQEFCDAVKPEWKAAVVATLLPTLGTIMSKLRARYIDGRLQSPSFQTVIEAPMGAGKGNLSDIANIILEPVKIKDDEGNTQINIYNQKAIKANGSATLGDPPDVCVRKIIGAFTEAGFNDTLNTSKGLHIWSGVNEIDQVASVWKSLSYILRLAFDNAMYGRTIQSQKQYRGERPLFMNTFLCGTPNAVKRVYNDPEDGLVSRTIFFKLLFETPDIPLTRITNNQLSRIRSICKKLHDKYTIDDNNIVAQEQVISLGYLCNHMKGWLGKRIADSNKYGSMALDRFRRRDACIGFRAGMVAHAIYDIQNKKITDKERTIIKNFAEWVADFSLMMHDYKFGSALNDVLADDSFEGVQQRIPFLDQLPDTFTLSEAYRTFSHMKEATVRSILSRLVGSGDLESPERGVYMKVIK